jgi:hypothetical protein
MANGQATKIIFPFEISQLIKQGAKFLGATDESLEEPSKIVLDETILGNIPKREEVETILKEMQEAIPQESARKSSRILPGERLWKPSQVRKIFPNRWKSNPSSRLFSFRFKRLSRKKGIRKKRIQLKFADRSHPHHESPGICAV